MITPSSPPQPLTFLDALRLARGCHDYSGGYGGTPCAEAFHAGIGTVIEVLTQAASGQWDYQLQAVYDEGARAALARWGTSNLAETRSSQGAVMTDNEIEVLFRTWWSTSYPTPPGPHALMTHIGWARFLLEQKR
jgi:hypothetical protein